MCKATPTGVSSELYTTEAAESAARAKIEKKVADPKDPAEFQELLKKAEGQQDANTSSK